MYVYMVATCNMQLKNDLTSLQFADGAHKQSISGNHQHQSRLKHLSQSGTRQVKAQTQPQPRFGSARLLLLLWLLFVCHIIQSSAKSTPTPTRCPFPPPLPPQVGGNCSRLSQSVSQTRCRRRRAAIGRGQERVTSNHNIHGIHSSHTRLCVTIHERVTNESRRSAGRFTNKVKVNLFMLYCDYQSEGEGKNRETDSATRDRARERDSERERAQLTQM